MGRPSERQWHHGVRAVCACCSTERKPGHRQSSRKICQNIPPLLSLPPNRHLYKDELLCDEKSGLSSVLLRGPISSSRAALKWSSALLKGLGKRALNVHQMAGKCSLLVLSSVLSAASTSGAFYRLQGCGFDSPEQGVSMLVPWLKGISAGPWAMSVHAITTPLPYFYYAITTTLPHHYHAITTPLPHHHHRVTITLTARDLHGQVFFCLRFPCGVTMLS